MSKTTTDDLMDLMAQKAELERRITSIKKNQVEQAISDVRRIVTEFGLTAEDVFGKSSRGGQNKGVKVAPKYRDPASGAEWSGRGKAPKWIAGQNYEDFKI